ncbi:MAG TPA: hypothetical protein VFY71_09670 [Planctomycetota bacterium]|nr:hypothetical protein [Planctomycetota bacterium]
MSAAAALEARELWFRVIVFAALAIAGGALWPSLEYTGRKLLGLPIEGDEAERAARWMLQVRLTIPIFGATTLAHIVERWESIFDEDLTTEKPGCNLALWNLILFGPPTAHGPTTTNRLTGLLLDRMTKRGLVRVSSHSQPREPRFVAEALMADACDFLRAMKGFRPLSKPSGQNP